MLTNTSESVKVYRAACRISPTPDRGQFTYSHSSQCPHCPLLSLRETRYFSGTTFHGSQGGSVRENVYPFCGGDWPDNSEFPLLCYNWQVPQQVLKSSCYRFAYRLEKSPGFLAAEYHRQGDTAVGFQRNSFARVQELCGLSD